MLSPNTYEACSSYPGTSAPHKVEDVRTVAINGCPDPSSPHFRLLCDFWDAAPFDPASTRTTPPADRCRRTVDHREHSSRTDLVSWFPDPDTRRAPGCRRHAVCWQPARVFARPRPGVLATRSLVRPSRRASSSPDQRPRGRITLNRDGTYSRISATSSPKARRSPPQAVRRLQRSRMSIVLEAAARRDTSSLSLIAKGHAAPSGFLQKTSTCLVVGEQVTTVHVEPDSYEFVGR